jgi:antitoxin component of RelBE/YafQ-DinJ toxin-antitoxin module
MSTTTKAIGSRVNSEVYTLFTDVCNKEGVTMSQKINQLVTDCVRFPSILDIISITETYTQFFLGDNNNIHQNK